MDKATFLDLMDKYIDGTMSSAEKYEFDQMVKKDPLRQKELEIHIAIRNGIKKSARKDLLAELNEIKKEVRPVTNGNLRFLYNKGYLMIAATFITIIAVIVLFKNDSVNHSEARYVGLFEMKVLPMEGKLGGPPKDNIHLVLKTSDINEYEIKNDTLYIYTLPQNFNSLLLMDPVVTLDQERRIVIEIKQQKYIFKTKFK